MAPRALRGGSFNNNQRNVRCAYRNNNDPDNRNNNIGFRVVLSTFAAGNAQQRQNCCAEVNGGVYSWPRSLWNRANSNRPIPWFAWDGAPISMIEEGAFDEFCGWSNLLLAYQKASKGKRSRVEVASFEARLEENLLGLHQSLRDQRWKPAGYHSFYIHEPKRRLISAAPFTDRVVHHALCNILEPEFERGFVTESYANRKRKGNHRALDHAQRCARKYAYVLPLDIRKFFPCIDHEVLRLQLARKIRDPGILRVINLILNSGSKLATEESAAVFFPGDDLVDLMRPRGLPIGNLTSQFWANVYLNPLDHFIKRELGCHGYVRYVDDMLLFAESKSQLWDWMASVEQRLTQFRLVFHKGSHPRPVSEGSGFLGFRVFPDRRELKNRKGYHYQRRLKKMIGDYTDQRLTQDELLDSILSWNNHVGYGNTVGLRKAVFVCLPQEIAIAARKQYLRSSSRPANRMNRSSLQELAREGSVHA